MLSFLTVTQHVGFAYHVDPKTHLPNQWLSSLEISNTKKIKILLILPLLLLLIIIIINNNNISQKTYPFLSEENKTSTTPSLPSLHCRMSQAPPHTHKVPLKDSAVLESNTTSHPSTRPRDCCPWVSGTQCGPQEMRDFFKIAFWGSF
jgi:hypothetical protein